MGSSHWADLPMPLLCLAAIRIAALNVPFSLQKAIADAKAKAADEAAAKKAEAEAGGIKGLPNLILRVSNYLTFSQPISPTLNLPSTPGFLCWCSTFTQLVPASTRTCPLPHTHTCPPPHRPSIRAHWLHTSPTWRRCSMPSAPPHSWSMPSSSCRCLSPSECCCSAAQNGWVRVGLFLVYVGGKAGLGWLLHQGGGRPSWCW